MEASLSFLGVGVPPPAPAWGTMIAEGRSYIVSAWWICIFPGAAVMLTVVVANLLGDRLTEALDPGRRARRGQCRPRRADQAAARAAWFHGGFSPQWPLAARHRQDVDRVSLRATKGYVGLVGESGSGKSDDGHSTVLRLLPAGRRAIVGGSVLLRRGRPDPLCVGANCAGPRPERSRSSSCQDPIAALNPLFTIFRQVRELAVCRHGSGARTLRELRAEPRSGPAASPRAPEWRTRGTIPTS